jgi:hypothetical protein
MLTAFFSSSFFSVSVLEAAASSGFGESTLLVVSGVGLVEAAFFFFEKKNQYIIYDYVHFIKIYQSKIF